MIGAMAIEDRDGRVRIVRTDGGEETVYYRRATSLVSRGLAEFAKPKRRRAPKTKPTLPDAAEKVEDVATAEDMPPVSEG